MPRNRSAGRAPARSAPSRPMASSSSSTPQQQRSATTMAAPQQRGAQPTAQQGSQGPGLFGQMASTAAGVAVGSSIGHAMGGFFGGGSSEAAPAQESVQSQSAQQSQQYGGNCQEATVSFTRCMDEHQGNMSICNWYLEQLKACQAAARQY